MTHRTTSIAPDPGTARSVSTDPVLELLAPPTPRPWCEASSEVIVIEEATARRLIERHERVRGPLLGDGAALDDPNAAHRARQLDAVLASARDLGHATDEIVLLRRLQVVLRHAGIRGTIRRVGRGAFAIEGGPEAIARDARNLTRLVAGARHPLRVALTVGQVARGAPRLRSFGGGPIIFTVFVDVAFTAAELLASLFREGEILDGVGAMAELATNVGKTVLAGALAAGAMALVKPLAAAAGVTLAVAGATVVAGVATKVVVGIAAGYLVEAVADRLGVDEYVERAIERAMEEASDAWRRWERFDPVREIDRGFRGFLGVHGLSIPSPIRGF